jgi:hypothetical protein
MMQSLLVIHPFQLPAGWKFYGATHHMHYLETIFIKQA